MSAECVCVSCYDICNTSSDNNVECVSDRNVVVVYFGFGVYVVHTYDTWNRIKSHGCIKRNRRSQNKTQISTAAQCKPMRSQCNAHTLCRRIYKMQNRVSKINGLNNSLANAHTIQYRILIENNTSQMDIFPHVLI